MVEKKRHDVTEQSCADALQAVHEILDAINNIEDLSFRKECLESAQTILQWSVGQRLLARSLESAMLKCVEKFKLPPLKM